MKKTLSIIAAALLMLTLFAACSDEPADPAPAATPTPTPASGSESTPTPASGSDATPAPDPDPAPDSDFDTNRVIAVFTREEGSGTRDAFVSVTGVGEDMYEEAVVVSETNEILSKVEENNFAIGYISIGSLSDRVKALNIDGVAPSDKTVKDGSYAIQRPFLVCVNEEKAQDELVQDFIAFMLSAQGQEKSGTKWTTIDDNAPDYTSKGLTGTLKVGGSTSVDPLMQVLRQAYIDLNPGVEIEISGGGSGTGISEATSGVLDIGMSSRALKDTEKSALEGIEIALDGVAVIVNPANPLGGLSIGQVKDIFTGASTRWSDAG